MRFSPTDIPGVVLIDPDVHRDARGFFLETYHWEKYSKGGVHPIFVQDNHSRSQKGTLRGLHIQLNYPQAKLLRAVEGEIFDVAVDVRVGSPTFGRWVGATLSAENFRQIFIPQGFAHGFCVLSDSAQVEYKCSDFYRPEDEIAIQWDDPAIGIRWPVGDPLLSERDKKAKTLAELKGKLPVFEGYPSKI